MISFIRSWAEQVIVAVIIASIIEMILPENKNKKYIKMIIGMYILFNIISPVIKNNNYFNFEEFNIEKYASTTSSGVEVNQESMDKRLEQLYIEELEKDLKNKVKEKGYNVTSCKIDAVLNENSSNKGINKIKLKVSKLNSTNDKNSSVNSIEKVEIKVGLDKILSSDSNEEKKDNEASKIEIAELRKTLSDYYQLDIKKIDITND